MTAEAVEVDALALMLDGTTDAGGWRITTGWVRELERNGEQSGLAIRRDRPEFGEVAEAILELEAWADWRPLEVGYSDYVPHLGQLGSAAYDISLARIGIGHESHVWLEAAALLRDGWRP